MRNAFLHLGALPGDGVAGALPAQLREAGQQRAFVSRVALHHLHEARNEVVTPQELHVDVAPGLGDTVAIADQQVEDDGGPHEDRHDEDEQGW